MYFRGSLYIGALSFLFVGIAIASDIFMSSIEMITSKKRIVKFYDPEAQVMQRREVLIWNETVANLTLMALGSYISFSFLGSFELYSKSYRSIVRAPSILFLQACIFKKPRNRDSSFNQNWKTCIFTRY